MKHKIIIPFAVLATIGLSGCAINDEKAAQDRNTNITQPLGYYSNEHPENNGGNATILDDNDNDGPITEIMDRSLCEQGNDRRTNITRVRNDTTNFDGNYNQSDNRRSFNGITSSGIETRTTNVDGNYNQGDNRSSNKNFNNSVSKNNISEKIGNAAASVKNVQDVRAIVYGNDVLIAVDLKDEKRALDTTNAVRKAVNPYLKGRSVTILSDEDTFSRVKTIENDIRNGVPNVELKNLFRTLQNNR